MARNKLTDLNDHLFAQLERLNDEELTAEQTENEVKKAKAISAIAAQIIKSSKVTLDAMKLVASGQFEKEELPDQFTQKALK
jgi:hypothetical protein